MEKYVIFGFIALLWLPIILAVIREFSAPPNQRADRKPWERQNERNVRPFNNRPLSRPISTRPDEGTA
jgi:hypothetical protein